MKQIYFLVFLAFSFVSCTTARMGENVVRGQQIYNDTLITQSLFNDKNATISEDAIQRVLSGNYNLPKQLRVAIVKLESPQLRRSYWSYWSDEDYLKSQQSYLDLFSQKLRQSSRVTKLNIVPDLLISNNPSFTNIREAAVRMQSDIVIIYSITGDIYSNYKLFSKSDIKAFATTQLILLDVRTGLIPFSAIVTKDHLSQKNKNELNTSEARNRILHQAILLTINDIGQQLSDFLNPQ